MESTSDPSPATTPPGGRRHTPGPAQHASQLHRPSLLSSEPLWESLALPSRVSRPSWGPSVEGDTHSRRGHATSGSCAASGLRLSREQPGPGLGKLGSRASRSPPLPRWPGPPGETSSHPVLVPPAEAWAYQGPNPWGPGEAGSRHPTVRTGARQHQGCISVVAPTKPWVWREDAVAFLGSGWI